MTLTEPSVIFVTPIQLHLLVHTRDPTGLTDNVPFLRLTDTSQFSINIAMTV